MDVLILAAAVVAKDSIPSKAAVVPISSMILATATTAKAPILTITTTAAAATAVAKVSSSTKNMKRNDNRMKQPICPQLISNKGSLTSKIDEDFLGNFIREKPSGNKILQRSQGSSSQRGSHRISQQYDTTNEDEEEDDYEDDNGSLKYDEDEQERINLSTNLDKASSCRILPGSPLRNHHSNKRGIKQLFQHSDSIYDDPVENGYEDDFASLEEDKDKNLPRSHKIRRIRRNWTLYIQLDDTTSKVDPLEDLKYLKSLVKNNLGTHVYKEAGNKPGEYVAICKEHDRCEHMVKVGPGENDLFKIMISGDHSTTSKERPEHGIAGCLLKRITQAANLNETAFKIMTDLEMDKGIDKNMIPSTLQLNNKLAYLKRKREKRPIAIIEDVNTIIHS